MPLDDVGDERRCRSWSVASNATARPRPPASYAACRPRRVAGTPSTTVRSAGERAGDDRRARCRCRRRARARSGVVGSRCSRGRPSVRSWRQTVEAAGLVADPDAVGVDAVANRLPFVEARVPGPITSGVAARPWRGSAARRRRAPARRVGQQRPRPSTPAGRSSVSVQPGCGKLSSPPLAAPNRLSTARKLAWPDATTSRRSSAACRPPRTARRTGTAGIRGGRRAGSTARPCRAGGRSRSASRCRGVARRLAVPELVERPHRGRFSTFGTPAGRRRATGGSNASGSSPSARARRARRASRGRPRQHRPAEAGAGRHQVDPGHRVPVGRRRRLHRLEQRVEVGTVRCRQARLRLDRDQPERRRVIMPVSPIPPIVAHHRSGRRPGDRRARAVGQQQLDSTTCAPNDPSA